MEVAPQPAASRSWSFVRSDAAAAAREYGLFLLGTGAIALHVLDDSFFQPQPGTSAGDHLASGLVPLAALVLAAATYQRVRAGLRAAIALTVGLLGTVAGAGEAGYYALKIGPSGDDYTGSWQSRPGFSCWRSESARCGGRGASKRAGAVATSAGPCSAHLPPSWLPWSCPLWRSPTSTRTSRVPTSPRPTSARPTRT